MSRNTPVCNKFAILRQAIAASDAIIKKVQEKHPVFGSVFDYLSPSYSHMLDVKSSS